MTKAPRIALICLICRPGRADVFREQYVLLDPVHLDYIHWPKAKHNAAQGETLDLEIGAIRGQAESL